MDEPIQTLTSDEASEAQRREHFITPESLERLLKTREQLIQETNDILFEDSVEVLRREREKRTRYLMQVATGNYDEDPYSDDEVTPKEQP